MTKRNTTHINLEHKGKHYPLFALGYTKEGGFFIKDMIGDGGEYLIYKMTVPVRAAKKFGENWIPFSEGQTEHWITNKFPKITHHVDGNGHVSGYGITSGFDESSPKGIFSQSVNLEKMNNDGGPIFQFIVRNIYKISSSDCIKGVLIAKRDQMVNFYDPPKDENDCCYLLEFFYILKKDIEDLKVNKDTGCFSFCHPGFGIIPLKYIPSLNNAPGIIGVFTHKISRNPGIGCEAFPNEYIFGLNGAPGKVINGKFEQISIVYPYLDNGFFLREDAGDIDYSE
jgi:hypothetical protein